MQLSHYKPRIIEKIVTTEQGDFLARFVVVSEGNSFKLKLVDMLPVAENQSLTHSVVLLEAPKTIQTYEHALTSSIEVISPYSNLLFFVSQPTRAPSSI